MKILLKIALVAGAALIATSANAVPISASGNLGGQTVDATGTLTAGAGQVTVTLNNLQANPISIIQCISGVSFNITDATGSGSLTTVSDSGNKTTTIGSGGVYSAPATGDALTRWKATETGLTILLTTLSGGNPDRLIIGPPNGSNLYSAANPSIIGDNPQVWETATFVISIPGVTANSTISGGTILFGTDGSKLTSVPDGGATALLLGAALSGLGMMVRRIKS